MIGDIVGMRGWIVDIKKSQKTLPLRSINCIPVGVAGNMEAGR
jgi:hypothetical protein